jgi:hypothetical protein
MAKSRQVTCHLPDGHKSMSIHGHTDWYNQGKLRLVVMLPPVKKASENGKQKPALIVVIRGTDELAIRDWRIMSE